jgi:hypothetical protein
LWGLSVRAFLRWPGAGRLYDLSPDSIALAPWGFIIHQPRLARDGNGVLTSTSFGQARVPIGSSGAPAIFAVLFCGAFIHSRGSRLDDKIVFIQKITSKPLAALDSDVSSKTKLKAWTLAFKLIGEAPVWGIGVDQFPEYYEAAYSGIDTKLEG